MARLLDPGAPGHPGDAPTLLDVRLIAMSPQAFTLSGFERVDGADYAQSWLVVRAAPARRRPRTIGGMPIKLWSDEPQDVVDDNDLLDTIRRMRDLWDSLTADERAAVLAFTDETIEPPAGEKH